jgi:hypothetical protein|tara:strand:+ start:3678 stop:3896 length:219 start_codon:yes stop_codon:yes gene_type:complete
VKTLWGMVLLWTLVIEDQNGTDLEASRKMVYFDYYKCAEAAHNVNHALMNVPKFNGVAYCIPTPTEKVTIEK